jgi:predicted transposase
MNLTYNIELITTNDERNQIIKFLTEQQSIMNFLSKQIFDNKTILSLKVIHQKYYRLLRNQFPDVPSQLIIKCEQEILQNYKSIKSNKHKIKKLVTKHNLSLRLDKRLYSKFTQMIH